MRVHLAISPLAEARVIKEEHLLEPQPTLGCDCRKVSLLATGEDLNVRQAGGEAGTRGARVPELREESASPSALVGAAGHRHARPAPALARAQLVQRVARSVQQPHVATGHRVGRAGIGVAGEVSERVKLRRPQRVVQVENDYLGQPSASGGNRRPHKRHQRRVKRNGRARLHDPAAHRGRHAPRRSGHAVERSAARQQRLHKPEHRRHAAPDADVARQLPRRGEHRPETERLPASSKCFRAVAMSAAYPTTAAAAAHM
eukprot:scaffold1772_cov112-Isochrysis_galbana.AAC.1